MAQAHLAATFNKDGFDLINNFTYGALNILHTLKCLIDVFSSFLW